MAKNFLLEIGTEELPTDSLSLLEDQFRTKLESRLREARLAFGKLDLATTPRRAVLAIQGLSSEQASEAVEWIGPAWEKAYDASGKPTEALRGFLRSKKLKDSDIVKKETSRGHYAAAQRTVEGKKVEQILPSLLAELLKDFSFPKAMRWDRSNFSFPRPIRWILSLYGAKILPWTLGEVRSDRYTFGHRFLCPRRLSVKEADQASFKKILLRAHVILDLEERKEMIGKQFAAKVGKAPGDEELVSITAQLVEEPFLVVGKFDSSFLSLPSEILSTCMKKYQKIFAVYGSQGKLKARFVAVLNGRKKNIARISRDYQEVLEAKLRDAQFFYHEDRKQSLEKKVARLKDIIFLGKLGNMQEKVNRLIDLSKWLSQTLKLPEAKGQNLQRAAFLCKADLLTQMVYEFPELQGIMGREYAKSQGEAEQVCLAIADHYLPRNLAQSYKDLSQKQSQLGSLLAILEKIDTLVGAFSIGLEPTGSQDPYALRRAGGGIVKIIRAFDCRLDLKELAKEALRLYGSRLSKKAEDILASLESFFKERVAFELGIRSGSKEDQILKAVLKTSWTDMGSVFLRFRVLRTIYEKDRNGFQKAHKVIERTHNILKGVTNAQSVIKTELLKEPLEKKLYELVEKKTPYLQKLADEERFDTVTDLYAELFYEPIHEFFDKVLVNTEDLSLRENRQALMKVINRLYVDRVADLSLVSQLD